MQTRTEILLAGVLLWLAPGVVPCARAQLVQQAKLVGSGSVPSTGSNPGVAQGSGVALSADGNTALVGGPQDNNFAGAVWAFIRANGSWTQQGSKMTASDEDAGSSLLGASIALSADGNTAIVGGPRDSSGVGAAWIFTRSNGVWSQQGSKLVGSGAINAGGDYPTVRQGTSVAISSDGNTAIVGGPGDNFGIGAVWVFTRSNGVWSQQGGKLIVSDSAGSPQLGYSVALSADGNTAAIGGRGDNFGIGAVWVFTRTGGAWSQQGARLVGSGVTGPQSFQGFSVALASDGNTLISGGPSDNGGAGAFWVFTRSGSAWSQQGAKVVAGDVLGSAAFASDVALSSDGAKAFVGAPFDNSGVGGAWMFIRTNGAWAQSGSKLLPSGARGSLVALGSAVALSNDGATAIAGGPNEGKDVAPDYSATGAAWVYSTFAGNTAPVSVGPAAGSGATQTMVFTFSDPRGWQDLDVVNVLINNFLDGRNACYIAYSRPNGVLYLVPDAGGGLLPGLTLSSGSGSTSNSQCTIAGAGSSATGSGNTLTLTLNMSFASGFAGNKITYMAARDLQGNNSGWQALGAWGVPVITTFPAVTGVTPSRGGGSSQTFTFTFNDTKGYQDLGVVNILINNFLDGRQSCYLAYSRPFNVLYLVNDAGSALLPGLGLNATGNVTNSQCTVQSAGSSATGSGNTLTLVLNMSFGAGFAGNKVVYMAARDATDANNSGWQAMGSWTVQ
jgi:hypothetical protein